MIALKGKLNTSDGHQSVSQNNLPDRDCDKNFITPEQRTKKGEIHLEKLSFTINKDSIGIK